MSFLSKVGLGAILFVISGLSINAVQDHSTNEAEQSPPVNEKMQESLPFLSLRL